MKMPKLNWQAALTDWKSYAASGLFFVWGVDEFLTQHHDIAASLHVNPHWLVTGSFVIAMLSTSILGKDITQPSQSPDDTKRP